MITALVFFLAGMIVQGFLRIGIVIDRTGGTVYYGSARNAWKIW